jgi:redox-sensitive bicupin YhaK (pirin superfamily)
MRDSTLPQIPALRPIRQIVNGQPVSDGAGVELTRLIGTPTLDMLDPFLLLDVMRSDRPDDYLAGFPPHPHRGFETVTYLLAGRFRHRDSTGNEGVLAPGGVQWMNAGKGIVHSEMPEQEEGLLHGFQLWINLPKRHKMAPPAYQEYAPQQVPEVRREDGVRLRLLAGKTADGTQGPVRQALTEPFYVDVSLPPQGYFEQALPAAHNAFIYVIDGEVSGMDADGRSLVVAQGQLAVFDSGAALGVTAAAAGARLLLLAARPIGEPVARGGPFVMNSRAEVLQAFDDYASGRF